MMTYCYPLVNSKWEIFRGQWSARENMLFKGIIVLTGCCLPPNLCSAIFYSIQSCSNLFCLFGHTAFHKEAVSLLKEGIIYREHLKLQKLLKRPTVEVKKYPHPMKPSSFSSIQVFDTSRSLISFFL